MFRVLVLLGAILLFRAVLRREPRRSCTAVTPYLSALDGMMSAQQVSSAVDETMPYAARRTGGRGKAPRKAWSNRLLNATDPEEHAISAVRAGPTEVLRS